MRIICLHCKKVLLEEDGKKPVGKNRLSDCADYGESCAESKKYHLRIFEKYGIVISAGIVSITENQKTVNDLKAEQIKLEGDK